MSDNASLGADLPFRPLRGAAPPIDELASLVRRPLR
jgi:hypothetical protein